MNFYRGTHVLLGRYYVIMCHQRYSIKCNNVPLFVTCFFCMQNLNVKFWVFLNVLEKLHKQSQIICIYLCFSINIYVQYITVFLQYLVVRKNSFKIPNVQSEVLNLRGQKINIQTRVHKHRKQRWNKVNPIKTRGGVKSYFLEE
jgi:hypothetical protein